MFASKRIVVLLLVLPLALPVAVLGARPSGGTIKKCQDETGKWHYGDTAAEECAKSRITEITREGTTKREIAAPPTELEVEERARQRAEEQEEKQRADEQKRRDQLLLSTYGHEDDIAYVRDRKLAQIETSVKASEQTLSALRKALERLESQAARVQNDEKAAKETAKGIAQTQAQIVRHEALIAAKRKEQEAIRQQYAEELERYRELKRQQTK